MMRKRTTVATLLLSFALALSLCSATAFAAKTSAVNEAAQKPEASERNNAKTETVQKEFTAKELSGYNGKNGSKAYIAVKGVVYDVSDLFKNGQHHGARAGQDLTADFLDEHSMSRLKAFQVVGTLIGTTRAQSNTLTSKEQSRLEELWQKERELEQRDDALENPHR